jgi:hypothetical protein
MRATMVMTAAVLAIAVPTAVVAHNSNDIDKKVTPARHVDHSSLSLDGLGRGALPRDGFVLGNELHVGDDTVMDLAAGRGTVSAVARVDGGYMVAVRRGEGATARFVAEDGRTTGRSWPIEGGFAVSPERNVAAFVQPDGAVTAIQDAGVRYADLGTVPAGVGAIAVAVVGETCSARSEETGCKVFLTTSDERPRTYVAVPDGGSAQAVDTGLRRIVDLAPNGRLAGSVSVTDTGSCSEVREPDFTTVWKTCDHSFTAFSPDGTHLLAGPAYRDGAGDSSLAVLNASTGESVLALQTIPDVFVAQAAWEDDEHLLATVYQKGRWGIVRLDLDGNRRLVAGPVDEVEPYVSPYRLPTG